MQQQRQKEDHSDNFTLEELLTDVRSSGLYPTQRIDARVLEIHQSCQKSFELTEKTIKEKSRALEKVIRTKEASLTQLESEKKGIKIKSSALEKANRRMELSITQLRNTLQQKDEVIITQSNIIKERNQL